MNGQSYEVAVLQSGYHAPKLKWIELEKRNLKKISFHNFKIGLIDFIDAGRSLTSSGQKLIKLETLSI